MTTKNSHLTPASIAHLAHVKANRLVANGKAKMAAGLYFEASKNYALAGKTDKAETTLQLHRQCWFA